MVRCRICKEVIPNPKPGQSVCEGKHFCKCVVCGSAIPITIYGNEKKLCSTKCRSIDQEQRAKKNAKPRICELCGKEFYPLNKNQRICRGAHYFPCPICGKPVEYKDKNKERCCCRAHTILKRKQTNQRIYGGNSPASSKSVVEKMKSTNLKRYGVEWKAQTDEFQRKREATCLEKYGVPVSSQADSVKKKAEHTCMEHYGVKHAAQSEKVKRKTKEGFVKKYGVDNPMKLQQSKDKLKETSLEKYGVDHPWKNTEVQEKRKQTWIDKYGVDCPSKNIEVKNKQRSTLLDRYGTDNAMRVSKFKDKNKETQFKNYGTWYLNSTENRSNRSKPISKRNIKFQDVLTENSITSELEFCFEESKRRKFDVHITGTTILVELDSTHVHNSYEHMGTPYSCEKTTKQLSKTELAEQNNYSCVHVFDWDDWYKVARYVSCKYRIPSKMTTACVVEKDEAFDFFDKYDVQVLDNVQEYISFYGIRLLTGELVFVLASNGENYRYCMDGQYCLSSYLSTIISEFQLSQVTLLVDRTKYRRDIFNDITFKIKSTIAPRRYWYNGYNVVLDCPDTSYDKMLSENYLPVHDSGVLLLDVSHDM